MRPGGGKKGKKEEERKETTMTFPLYILISLLSAKLNLSSPDVHITPLQRRDSYVNVSSASNRLLSASVHFFTITKKYPNLHKAVLIN